MKYHVDIWEFELGWGSRLDETKEFETRDGAVAWATEYNAKYNPQNVPVPDWYMKAFVREGEPAVVLTEQRGDSNA